MQHTHGCSRVIGGFGMLRCGKIIELQTLSAVVPSIIFMPHGFTAPRWAIQLST